MDPPDVYTHPADGQTFLSHNMSALPTSWPTSGRSTVIGYVDSTAVRYWAGSDAPAGVGSRPGNPYTMADPHYRPVNVGRVG